jgi:trimethylamine:corrinoid methyltransferase-like protein
MQPKIELLSQELIDRILDEAFQLMMKPGIKVQYAEARELLAPLVAKWTKPTRWCASPRR